MKKTEKSIFAFVIVLAALLSALAPRPAAAAPIEPLTVEPANPKTFEEKVKAAQVIVLGAVDSVAALKIEGKSGGRNTREPYVASIRVEKVYKGNPGEGKIPVFFNRTENETKPPLVRFSPGERAVLFLRTSDTAAGYLETITPFSGKERPDYDLIKKLDQISAQQGLTGSMAAVLTLDTTSPEPGAPVVISFRIDNNGAQPVLFNSTPSPTLDLTISDPSGKTISPAYGARDAKAMSTQLRLIPGAYYGYSADISKIFTLKTPGKYTLYATFKPSAGRDQTAWSGAIRANPVSFEIPKSK